MIYFFVFDKQGYTFYKFCFKKYSGFSDYFIERRIKALKEEHFYTDDDGQKVKFDVTDEQKEKIKEAIENSKSKQSQQDSAQAVSDMGAR